MKKTNTTPITSITNRAIDIIEHGDNRSAWNRAVNDDAIVMIDTMQQAITDGDMYPDDLYSAAMIERVLLNGAADWTTYSWGGCGLIYNSDIAERYCTPSEYRRTRGGERRPNASEEWLDVQARALCQACSRVKRAIKQAITEINAEYPDKIEW